MSKRTVKALPPNTSRADVVYREAVLDIHAQLDGREWSPDTLDAIASILRGLGLPVRDVA